MHLTSLERLVHLPERPPGAVYDSILWTATSETVAVTVRRTRGGRLGHAAIDLIAGLLVSGIFNWSFIPPGRDYADVWRIFDLRPLLPRLLLHRPPLVGDQLMPGRQAREWQELGACPQNWTVIALKGPHWVGIPQWPRALASVRQRVPVSLESSGRVCVVLTSSWRIMLHHVKHWEQDGLVRRGVYALVTRVLRSLLRPLDQEGANGSTRAVSRPNRVISAALHARRADSVRGVLHSDADIQTGRSTAIVAATVAHLGRAVQPLQLNATVFTETRRPPVHNAPANRMSTEAKTVDSDPNDVWEHGCPPAASPAVRPAVRPTARPVMLPDLLQAQLCCQVRSGGLHEDLWSFVSSDVFVMALSSLSYVAAFMREAEAKLTLVTVARPFLTPSAFWMFWGPDDPMLPPSILFLNASTSAESFRQLRSAAFTSRTHAWTQAQRERTLQLD